MDSMKWDQSRRRLKTISRDLSNRMEEKYVMCMGLIWGIWTLMGKGTLMSDTKMRYISLFS